MKDSDFAMRKVASGLFGVLAMDATPEQLVTARRAVVMYNEGKSIGLILLLLRIKRTAVSTNPFLTKVIAEV